MKENKETRTSSLTPEQESKYHKISIIGSIFLGLLLVALVASILGVYLSDRKSKTESYVSPFETVGTFTISDFEKTMDNKSFNGLKYNKVTITKSDDKKKQDEKKSEEIEIDVKNITKVYILFHTDNIEGKLKEKIKTLNNDTLKEKGILFLTLSIDHEPNGVNTADCKKTIKRFGEDFTDYNLANEDNKKIFDDEKLYLVVIDVANVAIKNQNEFIMASKEKSSSVVIDEKIKEIIQE